MQSKEIFLLLFYFLEGKALKLWCSNWPPTLFILCLFVRLWIIHNTQFKSHP